MVLVDGVEVDDYTIQPVEGRKNRARFVFDFAPADGEHIHVVAIDNFEKNTITKFYVQQAMIDNNNKIVELDETVRFGQSKDTVMIVELNGVRLRPGNTNYYIGDGSTTVFLLPTSADESYTSLTFAEVQVWVDDVRKDASSYVLSEADGSTIPFVTFFDPPEPGTNISITYTGEAEYFYSRSNNTVRIRENISVASGSLLAIITSSAHDIFRFKTKVFIGTEQLISTSSFVPGFDEGGFDTVDFDTTTTVNTFKVEYDLNDALQNDAARMFVYIDGVKQIPNRDYIVDGGRVILAESIVITDTSVVIVTWMSPNFYKSASTFRIFKGMDDRYEFTRVAVDESTVLAQDLTITDTEIVVADANNLADPNPGLGIPGVIFIDGERIVYYTKSGNTLGQIRRGVNGTGAKLKHNRGDRVIDASMRTQIPDAETAVWYDSSDSAPSNGKTLQVSNTQQARFITALQGLNLDP
jgi:hypothetical protein